VRNFPEALIVRAEFLQAKPAIDPSRHYVFRIRRQWFKKEAVKYSKSLGPPPVVLRSQNSIDNEWIIHSLLLEEMLRPSEGEAHSPCLDFYQDR
jgi:hypothetical protein